MISSRPGDRPGARDARRAPHAERDGDHRRDVRDHRRPPGPDLGHQGAEEHERRRRAENAEHDQRRRSPSADDRAGGRAAIAAGVSATAAISERAGHRRARVDLGEAALEQHRPDRVADRSDQDRRRPEQLARRCRRRRGRPARRRPAKPIIKPRAGGPPARSAWSNRSASRATINGTEAIRIAASDDATCCSPAAISGNGITISTSA